MLGALRSDRVIRAHALDFDQSTSFSVDDPDRARTAPWSNYLRGVFQQLSMRGIQVPGLDLLIHGTIPPGAGLSSSAALEVATAELAKLASNVKLDPLEVARLCQQAESEFVGVQCGIMDQFASVFGVRNRALFLNCSNLECRTVELPRQTRILICDSGVRRSLDQSSYNQRHLECNQALDLIRSEMPELQNLCELIPTQLQDFRPLLPDPLYQRVRHVITENQRVIDSVQSLKNGDAASFGRLLFASHESLRNDFEVSCADLDLLVDLAARLDGTLGARMTGGGFRGCTINLVEEQQMEQFSARMKEGYQKHAGRQLPVHACVPWDGVTSRRL